MSIYSETHSGQGKTTTPSQVGLSSEDGEKIDLFEIAIEMKMSGIPDWFIVKVVRTALDFAGVADLMKLWAKETDQHERNEIVADLQDMLDACSNQEKVKEVYIKFNDLDTIAANIRVFKDSLLQTINDRGGINHLAELTGIPQSSLSRFFNSNSMPQRTTLLKIAKALELDEIKIELLRTK